MNQRNFALIAVVLSVAVAYVMAADPTTKAPVTVACTDMLGTSKCNKTIEIRGGKHCLKDKFFGRFQCCLTCSKQPEVLADATGAKPTTTCADEVGSDGASYTKWCQVNVVPMSIKAKTSCNGPAMVQLRCKKSCNLCTQLNEYPKTPTAENGQQQQPPQEGQQQNGGQQQPPQDGQPQQPQNGQQQPTQADQQGQQQPPQNEQQRDQEEDGEDEGLDEGLEVEPEIVQEE